MKNLPALYVTRIFIPCSQELASVVPVLCQLNSYQNHVSYLFKIQPNIIFPSISRFLRCYVSFMYSTNTLYAFLFSHTCYCPANLILLDLIILIIFGEECKLRSSLLCSFLNPALSPYRLDPDTVLGILF
jgi:hypothetical protein